MSEILNKEKDVTAEEIAQTKTADNDMFIDDRLTEEQKAVIKEIMEKLPPEDRENVVYVDKDGKVYANKLELLEKYLDGTFAITPYPGTGAYRRVESNFGYSWVNNKVYLPAPGADLYIAPDTQGDGKSGDTMYIYTGGSAPGTEVDAGLQYSPTNNEWVTVLSVNSKRDTVSEPGRMKPGQEIELKFYCDVDDHVVLLVTGIDKYGQKKQYKMQLGAAGWRKNGSKCKIKRVTSIAQIKDKENFSTGSYIKNVKWSNCQIGTDSSNAQKWSSLTGYDTLSYPSSKVVIVTYVDQANETVNIVLNQ